MHSPLITRAKATRLAGVIVAVALCAGVGGLTAMSASAAASVAPSAPTNLFADNYNGVNFYVTWDPTTAGNGSDDADSFTVSLDDGVPADSKSFSVLGDTTEASLTSVNPGTYAVTVTAVNTFGSATSDPLTFVMDANTHVPNAPLNVAAHNAGDGIVSITWDAPVSEGDSPITGYIASITFPDSVDPSYGGPYGLWNGQIIGASDREYTFWDVPFDHGDFVVTVNAVNDVDYGYEASTAPAALVRSTVPSAPTQLSASSTTANTVTVTWAAPSSDGGFAVSDYLVTMGQDFGTFTDGDGRSATFTGVPAGSHTVSVSGFNVNGMSEEATAQVTVLNPTVVVPPVVTPPVVTPPVVTPPVVAPVVTAPSVPRTVSDVVARGGKASVSFKPPASTHGAAVTRYIVTLAGQEKWVSATTRTVHFKGLTKGTYAAKVFAQSRAGRSKAASVKVHVSAAKAASAPLTLKHGMRGTTIVKLQAKLSMPSAARSGLFTAGTRTAVVKWQKKHHKSSTGVVNAAMRTSLGI
jgi:uncharacterized protein (DUF2141 family)